MGGGGCFGSLLNEMIANTSEDEKWSGQTQSINCKEITLGEVEFLEREIKEHPKQKFHDLLP